MTLSRLLLIGMAIAPTGLAQTGSISGTVTDGAGKPVSAVLVYCGRIAPDASVPASHIALTPLTVHSATDSSGLFKIQGLPAGVYQLCALAAISGRVSSCEWGSRPLTTTLAASGAVQGLILTMGSGDIVQIQVRDANSKISGGANLSLGSIADNGSYRFAKLVSTVGQVLNYEMTIPTGRKSWLVVDTALQIADAQGAAVLAGKQTIALSGPMQIALSVH